jgi:hypothetical protein
MSGRRADAEATGAKGQADGVGRNDDGIPREETAKSAKEREDYDQR